MDPETLLLVAGTLAGIFVVMICGGVTIVFCRHYVKDFKRRISKGDPNAAFSVHEPKITHAEKNQRIDAMIEQLFHRCTP